jgi:hypothetical protein
MPFGVLPHGGGKDGIMGWSFEAQASHISFYFFGLVLLALTSFCYLCSEKKQIALTL